MLVVLVCSLSAASGSAGVNSSPPPCRIRPTTFDGWPAEEITNAWDQLILVPSLGGRLMQVTFAGHPYLFVNRELQGKYIPPSQADGRWINYGGDKVWPMPEGNKDERHWVLESGPLDDGNYALTVISRSPRCTVRLQGPPDPSTGLQYSREIGIGSDSPEISFHAVMKNVTGHPIRWAMQSVTQYNLADLSNPALYNHSFWAFTPVNPQSSFQDGYHVVDGLADDPSFSVKDGLFLLNWKYLENEVWLDSTAGWVAIVDEQSDYAMVERSTYLKDGMYPGKATTIFYKNGPGVELDAGGYPQMTPADPQKTPYYMEAELNGPMVVLQPGATSAMDTEWFPSRLDQKVDAVKYPGVVAQPFAVRLSSGEAYATGTFGVFFPGTLKVRFFDQRGVYRDAIALQAVDPKQEVTLTKKIAIPSYAVRASLHLIGLNGTDYGSLGEAAIEQKAR